MLCSIHSGIDEKPHPMCNWFAHQQTSGQNPEMTDVFWGYVCSNFWEPSACRLGLSFSVCWSIPVSSWVLDGFGGHYPLVN